MQVLKIVSAAFLASVIAGGLVWAQSAEKKDAPTSPTEAKLAAAREVFDLDARRHAAGFSDDQSNVEFQHTWSVRLMESEREAADATPDARRLATQHHLDRMKDRAKVTESLYDAGQASKVDVLACRYFVAEAGRWMQDANAKP